MILPRLVFLALAAVAGPARAEVEPAPIFCDHMVLQRGCPVPVWGRAAAGAEVVVEFAGQKVSAVANAGGHWEVVLAPLEVRAEPAVLSIRSGAELIALRDVLVGEVWLCSGQSNMAFELKKAASAAEEHPRAKHQMLRLFDMQGSPWPGGGAFDEAQRARCTPERYYDPGQWRVCTPAAAGEFSAVGYFFGQELLRQLKVPVGLIHNAIGGSPIEAWISPQRLGAMPEDWLASEAYPPWCRERAAENLGEHRGECGHPFAPSFLYAAAIAPLKRFSIRGVIWYQGESNSHDPPAYAQLFPRLVADWRAAWGDEALPFLFVQLASISTEKGYPAERWGEFRDVQRRMLRLPHTGMAVCSDLGHRTDVHPRKKRPVGQRLARWALVEVYGKAGVRSGPLYRAFQRRGREMVLYFEHVGSGLAARGGGELVGFEMAGQDGIFHAAKARIEGVHVVLSAPEVEDPERVRYAWSPFPEHNLINQEGLPASTFCNYGAVLGR